MQYRTITGLDIELPTDPSTLAFHAQLLAAETPHGAEELLYSATNPLALVLEGRPSWTADALRSPSWAYLADAVGRVRLAAGDLNLAAVESACSMSVAEAAASLGVSEQAVRQAISSGDLVGVRKQGMIYLDAGVVARHLTRRAHPSRTDRVPCLYARLELGKGPIALTVRDATGLALAGEVVGVDQGITSLRWPTWSQATIELGSDQKIVVEPAHGRAVTRVAFGEVAVWGRWVALR